MEFLTISQVSKQFHISTRMLRYYEKEGLICSRRMQDYSYRVYDGEAVKRPVLVSACVLCVSYKKSPFKKCAYVLC